jgi:hypothetical protein
LAVFGRFWPFFDFFIEFLGRKKRVKTIDFFNSGKFCSMIQLVFWVVRLAYMLKTPYVWLAEFMTYLEKRSYSPVFEK